MFFFFFAKLGELIAFFFFFQAEDGIRDLYVTGVKTCALPISSWSTGKAGPRGCSTGRTCGPTCPAATVTDYVVGIGFGIDWLGPPPLPLVGPLSPSSPPAPVPPFFWL